ncbi:MAG: hypothetical protein HGB17_17680, partial [Syntrophobacteraceae bacterium]|nr:hypothetical protein [Syntrophobacteraceae bacterium]
PIFWAIFCGLADPQQPDEQQELPLFATCEYPFFTAIFSSSSLIAIFLLIAG